MTMKTKSLVALNQWSKSKWNCKYAKKNRKKRNWKKNWTEKKL